MNKSVLGAVLCGLLSFTTIANAQFVNPSFESGSFFPTAWEESAIFDSTAATVSYIQNGDADDGVDYIRFTTDGLGFVIFPRALDTILPGNSNNELEPNCVYRITTAVRRSDASHIPVVVFDLTGSAGSGNTGLELFSPEAELFIGSTSDPVGSWYDFDFEVTTPVDGFFDLTYLPRFGSGGVGGGAALAASTLDVDNIRAELIERLLVASTFISTSGGFYSYSNTGCIIQFISNETGGVVTVELVQSSPGDIGGGNVIGKYWIITSELTGVFSAIPSFSYTDLELSTAGLNENDLQLIRRDNSGSAWALVPSTVDTVENTIRTTAPVSAFSEWAIATTGFVAPGGPSNVDVWNLYQ